MSRFFKEFTYYFITSHTLRHQKLFDTDSKKDIILNRIIDGLEKFGLKDFYFGINSNHYHLLAYFGKYTTIPKLLNYINGGSSFELNNLDNARGRMVWDEYHLYLVEDDHALYQIKGYVIGNPYKHGEVETIKKLKNYKYSSFSDIVMQFGESQAEDMVLSCINLNLADFKKGLKLLYN